MYKTNFKKITVLGNLFMLFSNISMAQTVIDTVQYRIIYDAQLRTITDKKSLSNDEHILDIGKNNITRYYSLWKMQRKEIIDSIYADGGNIGDIQREIQKQGIETSHFSYDIIKHYPTKEEQTVTYSASQKLQYNEKIEIEWTLEDGDSIILGYMCRKATTFYHGRTWIVWYTQDISISDGPWKLCGLPGLILNAKDSNNDFIFNCIGIEHPVNKTITLQEKKIIKLEAQKAHQTIEKIERNPLGIFNMSGKKVKILVNGKDASADLKFLNRVFIESYQ